MTRLMKRIRQPGLFGFVHAKVSEVWREFFGLYAIKLQNSLHEKRHLLGHYCRK